MNVHVSTDDICIHHDSPCQTALVRLSSQARCTILWVPKEGVTFSAEGYLGRRISALDRERLGTGVRSNLSVGLFPSLRNARPHYDHFTASQPSVSMTYKVCTITQSETAEYQGRDPSHELIPSECQKLHVFISGERKYLYIHVCAGSV
jgi:hypothetical protein